MDWAGFDAALSAANFLEGLEEAILSLTNDVSSSGQTRRQGGLTSRRNELGIELACPADDSSCVYSCLAAGFHAEVRDFCSRERQARLLFELGCATSVSLSVSCGVFRILERCIPDSQC